MALELLDTMLENALTHRDHHLGSAIRANEKSTYAANKQKLKLKSTTDENHQTRHSSRSRKRFIISRAASWRASCFLEP